MSVVLGIVIKIQRLTRVSERLVFLLPTIYDKHTSRSSSSKEKRLLFCPFSSAAQRSHI